MSELEKVRAAKVKSQTIGEFLEWLHAKKGWRLAEWTRYSSRFMFPVSYNIECLLAEFFDIDLDKVEDEKRALQERCRKEKEQPRVRGYEDDPPMDYGWASAPSVEKLREEIADSAARRSISVKDPVDAG